MRACNSSGNYKELMLGWLTWWSGTQELHQHIGTYELVSLTQLITVKCFFNLYFMHCLLVGFIMCATWCMQYISFVYPRESIPLKCKENVFQIMCPTIFTCSEIHWKHCWTLIVSLQPKCFLQLPIVEWNDLWRESNTIRLFSHSVLLNVLWHHKSLENLGANLGPAFGIKKCYVEIEASSAHTVRNKPTITSLI